MGRPRNQARLCPIPSGLAKGRIPVAVKTEKTESRDPLQITPRFSLTRNGRTVLILAIALAVSLSVFLFHLPFAKNSFLVDDSADYLRAARDNGGSLYLNTNSASPVELRKLLHDRKFHDAPWDYLYFHDDNAAIRHFHAPFSFYAMHTVFALGGSDRAQRLTVATVTALTCGVLAAGLLLFDVPIVLAVPAALLGGVQSRYVEVSVDPTPHSWYMLFAVVFLLLFSRYLATQRFRSLVPAMVALGFAFATLEFSLELIVSAPLALAGLWATRRLTVADLLKICRQIARATPAFLITTFVLWPGGWLRGGYLECYGVTGATLVFKNKHAFGEKLTAAIIYDKLFSHHAAIFAIFLFFLSALIYLAAKKKVSVYSAVFSSYAVTALGLGIADHFRLGTYVSEFFLFLIAASVLLFWDLLPATRARGRVSIMILGSALLIAGIVQEYSQRSGSIYFRPWLQPVFAGISTNVPKGATILVNDNLEDFYTYLPGYDFEPTAERNSNLARTSWRASAARYFLLENETPPPSDARRIGSWTTYAPDHALNLYVINQNLAAE